MSGTPGLEFSSFPLNSHSPSFAKPYLSFLVHASCVSSFFLTPSPVLTQSLAPASRTCFLAGLHIDFPLQTVIPLGVVNYSFIRRAFTEDPLGAPQCTRCLMHGEEARSSRGRKQSSSMYGDLG